MSSRSSRLHLIAALNATRGKRVGVVGHSAGSTINIGFGRTKPRRFRRGKRGRRPGYVLSAESDLFLMSSWWLLRRGPWRLDASERPCVIKHGIRRLMGRRLISARILDRRQRLLLLFDRSISLLVWPDDDDMSGGWNFRRDRRIYWLGGSEDMSS